MSRPSNDELDIAQEFGSSFGLKPNLITDVFKNRRGRWTQIRIWSFVDLGICRKKDLFITTPSNKPIEDFQLTVFKEKLTPETEQLIKEFNNNLGVIDFNLESKKEQVEIEEEPIKLVEERVKEDFGGITGTVKRQGKKGFDDLIW